MKSKSQKLDWSYLLAFLFMASAYTYMVVDSFFRTGDFCIGMPGRNTHTLGCFFDSLPLFLGVSAIYLYASIHFFLRGIRKRGAALSNKRDKLTIEFTPN